MNKNSPDYWFLPSNKILLNQAYTSNNEVTALIDGKDYYEKLFNTIQSLNRDSNIHICGWRLNPKTKLLGNFPNNINFRQVISDAINKQVNVKSMLWQVAGTIGNSQLGEILDGISENSSDYLESLNDFIPGHGRENLRFTNLLLAQNQEAILDNRLAPGVFGSHHQKYVLIENKSNSESTAFIGGIDIAPDRWDTPLHDESPGREPELFNAWHDVQAQITGPAFSQLAECFYERWNDRRKPSQISNVPSVLNTNDIPSINGKGTCHVQVLRTYSCKTETFEQGDAANYSFAPKGDFTYNEAYIQAINKAENYIYIEDQYFWPCDVVDALSEAAKRGVTIILMLTNNYDVAGLVPYHNFLRNMAIEKVKASGKNVFVYTLIQKEKVKDDIYVHSKTMIIDDRYAVIGSANINSRSFTTDSEIGVAIVDSKEVKSEIKGDSDKCGMFPREYRKALWAEHLGMPSPDKALNQDGTPANFPQNDGVQIHHVVKHQVPFPRFCNPSFIPFIFMNTNTKCI